MTALKTLPLIPSKAPNLNIAPVDYSQRYQDELNNALRLYFNQIDNFAYGLLKDSGGAALSFPYISATDSATQYATAANTPTVVKWDKNEGSNSFTLNADFTATALVAGTYKITYSAQLANNDNAAHDAIFWLKINGADVARSTTIFTVPARKSAGVPSYICGYSEVVFDLNPNDKVGLYWGTDQAATSGGATGIYIYYQAAQTTPMAYPATPSVIGSITFVSALY